jgi:RimJ/RimL family protein N-acetyltransferase
MSFRLETARLALREWCEADAAPFHAMCSDPQVMEYLGPLMSRAEVDEAIARMQEYQRCHGHCFWAVERLADGAFLGFCGLKPGVAETPLQDQIEIGWRLVRHAWGQGYAREAAEASLDWGWREIMSETIMAMTVLGNVRSWSLMERLGMARQAELDFDYPGLASDDPLRPTIVYAKQRPHD